MPRRLVLLCAFAWALLLSCRSPVERPTVDEDEEPPPSVVDDVPPTGPAGPPEPVIDGWFEDWGPETVLAEDPKGDATGAFDVTSLHAQTRGGRLFLHFDTTTLLNLLAGPILHGTLVVVMKLPDARVLEIDLRAREASIDGAPAGLYSLGFAAAPTHAGTAFELKVDLEPLEVGVGSEVELSVRGSDEVGPIPIRFAAGPAPVDVRPLGRGRAAKLRLASLNTQEAGIVHPTRAPSIRRLLRAVAADVVALQEIGETPASEIASALQSSDPREDGKPWNVHAAGYGSILGNAIASRAKLLPIPSPTLRFAGAVVMLREPGPVAIFSAHLKCCGYLASDEDQERLAQAGALAETIRGLRAGTLGDAWVPYAAAPVIVVGDFNDVGSPELERVLTNRLAPALTRWRLPHLVGPNAHTWRSAGEGFPPGILDLLLYDPALGAERGYVFDTADLSAEHLDELGLEVGDSGATDHLMLVADFGEK